MARGAELLYAYGALRPADALLFYGFAVPAEGALAAPEPLGGARQAWRGELAAQLGLPLDQGAASARWAAALAEYDAALVELDAAARQDAEASPAKPDFRLADCRRVLRAERDCLAD